MKKDIYPFSEGQRLYEYLLIISPDEFVNGKIKEIKTLFAEQYGYKNTANLEPHVTLINFIQYHTSEFRIINCIEKFCRSVVPFTVTLKGFGNFEPHTIYAKLDSTVNVVAIVKNIRTRFKNLLASSANSKPSFTTKSHLTIARGMTHKQFDLAWKRWQKEDFLASFNVNQMILIKRELNPIDLKPIGTYRPVQDFVFSGQLKGQQMVLAL